MQVDDDLILRDLVLLLPMSELQACVRLIHLCLLQLWLLTWLIWCSSSTELLDANILALVLFGAPFYEILDLDVR